MDKDQVNEAQYLKFLYKLYISDIIHDESSLGNQINNTTFIDDIIVDEDTTNVEDVEELLSV